MSRAGHLALLALALVLGPAATVVAGGSPLQNAYTYVGHGKVIVNSDRTGYAYLDPGESVTYSIDIAGVTGTVERAYLYVGLYLYDSEKRWTVTFDGHILANNEYTAPHRTDTLRAVVRFDVTSMIRPGSRTYSVHITAVSVGIAEPAGFGVYSAALVIVCSDPSEPLIYVWVNDGCEPLDGESSTTVFPDLGQPAFGTATLYTLIAGGDRGYGDELLFDGSLVASDAFDGSTAEELDFDSFDVSSRMGSGGHTVTFRDVDDRIVVLLAVLVYRPMVVELVQPNGGESLTAGQTYTIRWRVSKDGGSISLSYSLDGGESWNVIDCIPNDPDPSGYGSYDWIVPEVDSRDCKIKVSWLSACPAGGGFAIFYHSDESDLTFAIHPVPDFTLTVEPESQTVASGGQAVYTLTVAPTGGFSEPLTVVVSGLPPGSTYSAIQAGPTTYTVTVGVGGTPGTYTIEFVATGGGKTHSVTATLTVTPPATTTPPPTTQPPTTSPAPTTAPPTTRPPTTTPPGFDFEIQASPSDLSLGPGESATVAITIRAVSGSGTVRLGVSGLPPDAEWSLTPGELSPPGTAILQLTAGSSTGSYSVVVTAEGGGKVKAAIVTLRVQPSSRCLVATATYGSELAEEVQLLREFRDDYVSRSYLGGSFIRAFNKFYYGWSPAAASFIARHGGVRSVMRVGLYPLIYALKTASRVSPLLPVNREANVLLVGVFACLLLGAMYVTPLLLAASALTERVSKVGVRYPLEVLALAAAVAALSLAARQETMAMISTSLVAALALLTGGLAAYRAITGAVGKLARIFEAGR